MKDIFYRVPQEFIFRLKDIYPRDYHSILQTFLYKKVPTFRVNRLKIDPDFLKIELRKNQIKFKEVSWYSEAFILVSISRREFQETFFYKEGLVYFQNLSSMLPVLVLDPLKGERVLDLCAAPGGKTTQILSLLRGELELIAVEKIKVRFYKLKATLKKQGADNLVKVFLLDGIYMGKRYPEYFDRILLDAPCSSEAQFLLSEPRTYSYWSCRKIKEAQRKQKKLLFSGINALRKGGLLVYSTCTFSPEENEEVIDWALDKFKDEIFLEDIKLPLRNIRNGLLCWKGRSFSRQILKTKRIIPDRLMEGFFIAKIRKKA